MTHMEYVHVRQNFIFWLYISFIERFHKNYIKSNGKKKYRFAILGVWTADLKKHIIMLTDDKDNTDFCYEAQIYECRRDFNV